MSNKIYVGNLAWATREDGLRQYFSQYGEVTESFVATDKMSDRSKGFGFVTFKTEEAAAAAVEKGNGAQIDGRAIKVDLARPMEPREERAPRSGGRSFGGGRSFNGGRRERRGNDDGSF